MPVRTCISRIDSVTAGAASRTAELTARGPAPLSGVAHALEGADLVEPSLRRALAAREPSRNSPAVTALTERELQVLTGMSQGKSNGQIGRELYLSEDTIKTHARRLFRKLGVNDRAQAVAHGFRRGLVS